MYLNIGIFAFSFKNSFDIVVKPLIYCPVTCIEKVCFSFLWFWEALRRYVL